MRAEYILFNLAMAVVLFFLNGWLGKLQYGIDELSFEYGSISFFDTDSQNFSGNFFQKIVNPTIFLAVVASVTQGICPLDLVGSLWLIVPMFWGIRLLYMIFKSRLRILNLKWEGFACVLSLILGEGVFWGLIRELIRQEEPIWISPTALRDAIWFAILAYLARTAWMIMKKLYAGKNLYPQEALEAYVMKRYDAFSRKFGTYIEEQVAEKYGEKLSKDDQERFIRTIYAIMIYEDYNRPYPTRVLERIAKATIFRRREMTLGVMQARAKAVISDCESIKIAMETLSGPFLSGEPDPEMRAAEAYNSGENYAREVRGIYDMLNQHLPSDRDAPDNEAYRI